MIKVRNFSGCSKSTGPYEPRAPAKQLLNRNRSESCAAKGKPGKKESSELSKNHSKTSCCAGLNASKTFLLREQPKLKSSAAQSLPTPFAKGGWLSSHWAFLSFSSTALPFSFHQGLALLWLSLGAAARLDLDDLSRSLPPQTTL